MEVVPTSVGRVARSWDEQHLDGQAAAEQIGRAATGGFSPAVRGQAARFVQSWQRHTDALSTSCESQADGLRAAIRDYVASDEAVGADLFSLLPYLAEVR